MGAVTSAFPGVPLYRFAILNAVYAAIAAVAPIVAGLGSKPDSVNPDKIKFGRRSLLGAGGLTLLALGGELTSLATLEWWSSAVPWARIVLMTATGLVGALVLIYAVMTTVALFPSQKLPEKVKGLHPWLSLQNRANDFAFSRHPDRSATI